MTQNTPQDSLSAARFATSRPRALAALVRSFRDIDLAEDLFQEACLRAIERWPHDGIPRDPLAWLIKVARNAGLDRQRKTRRLVSIDSAYHPEHGQPSPPPADEHQAEFTAYIDKTEYKEDILRLMFMCCHPQLKTADQLALALKVVAGFSLDEVARAFVVSAQTMQRRLSRAKQRATALAADLDTPGMAQRAQRLAAVQTTVYLLFNEGYAATGGSEHVRRTMCEEAVRLARLLLELFPGQAELMGLLALCLLQHARHKARIDKQGRLVSLVDQDRTQWDQTLIAEGRLLLEKALRKGQPGPLQIQAAIAAVHSGAAHAQDTHWAEIECLYQALEVFNPSPVVRLNRAVAVSKLRGPRAALAMLEPLHKALQHYLPYYSVRAALLEANDDIPAALDALHAALNCNPTRQETDFLTAKSRQLESSPTLVKLNKPIE